MKSKLAIAITLWGWLLFVAWLDYDHIVYKDQMIIHIFKPPYNYKDTTFHLLIILVPIVYTFMGYFVDKIANLLKKVKESEEKFRALSSVDELTGINNRRAFFNIAEQQLKIAKRIKKGMSLLFIDVDKLKYINDNLGHNEGDSALIDTANILKNTFRESDILARIGGDEFVVLAIESSEADHEILVSRLQNSLKNYNTNGNRRFNLSLSIGFSHFNPENPCSIEELLSHADTQMYDKKQKIVLSLK